MRALWVWNEATGSKVAGKRDVEAGQRGPSGVNEFEFRNPPGTLVKVNLIDDSSILKVHCSTERDDMWWCKCEERAKHKQVSLTVWKKKSCQIQSCTSLDVFCCAQTKLHKVEQRQDEELTSLRASTTALERKDRLKPCRNSENLLYQEVFLSEDGIASLRSQIRV